MQLPPSLWVDVLVRCSPRSICTVAKTCSFFHDMLKRHEEDLKASLLDRIRNIVDDPSNLSWLELNIISLWMEEIVPSLKSENRLDGSVRKKVTQACRTFGIPMQLRRLVWPLLTENILNLTESRDYVANAAPPRTVQLDIPRTLRLQTQQQRDFATRVLSAIEHYNPDQLGYQAGMNEFVATLMHAGLCEYDCFMTVLNKWIRPSMEHFAKLAPATSVDYHPLLVLFSGMITKLVIPPSPEEPLPEELCRVLDCYMWEGDGVLKCASMAKLDIVLQQHPGCSEDDAMVLLIQASVDKQLHLKKTMNLLELFYPINMMN